VNNWRERILKEFTPDVARLTLVADPDGLLLEEGILECIRERAFELIPFEDDIAFRYAYESRFRSRWDRGENTDLVVVLRSHANDLSCLPYDLLQAGRQLSFNLGDIFPNLSYPVVSALERGDLDALYDAQIRHAPGQLGDNATKEFALRHVFEIAPELIKSPADLLRVLLRRHYRGQRVPPALDERFIQLLRANSVFDEWPLEKIIPDREVFFSFLQERWPVFLDREARKAETKVWERGHSYGLSIAGPAELPFDHQDIRIYVDNLFLEGVLSSVSHKDARLLSKSWVSVGIRTDPAGDRSRRLNKLLSALEEALPADDARHGDWLHFARGWAELALLAFGQAGEVSGQNQQRVSELRSRVDETFCAWLGRRYAGLINLPPVPPVMLHHLPRFLLRQITEQPQSKVALVVLDGLAMDQWLVIRDVLKTAENSWRFREYGVFAWIPSLTSVSRQAIFAGRAPVFFPNSIQSTHKEQALWNQFWADQGLAGNQIVYIKGLGEGGLEEVSEAISHPKARVAGLVIDKIDKIMHGMELGTAGMHNQVQQWAQQSYLKSLLNILHEQSFRVYLTSDHGNIEAEGCGKPGEGVSADLRGERARVYPDALLRSKTAEQFPKAIEWPNIGLPEGFLPLLASGREAFVLPGQRAVCHGGAAIEEVVVPFVEIEKDLHE